MRDPPRLDPQPWAFQYLDLSVALCGQTFLLLSSADVEVCISLVRRCFSFADMDGKTHIGQHRTKGR